MNIIFLRQKNGGNLIEKQRPSPELEYGNSGKRSSSMYFHHPRHKDHNLVFHDCPPVLTMRLSRQARKSIKNWSIGGQTMWRDLAQSLIDRINLSRATEEERTNLADNVSRLRRTSKHLAVADQLAADGPIEEQLLPEQNHIGGSLFDSISASSSAPRKERRAVGHWFTHSMAAARDGEETRARRSDKDFAAPVEPEAIDRETLLSQSAKTSALKGFILKNHEPMQLEESAEYTLPEDDVDDPLFNLAHNPDAEVRRSVAANEHLSVGAMWALVDDEDFDVRLHLIQNPSASIAMLEHLSQDSDPRVSRNARARLRSMYEEHYGIATGNLDTHESETESLRLSQSA
jgi:hypothetical protein